MKVKIFNFGCSMNEHENHKVKEYLIKNNYKISESDYDTLIVSCCAVTSENEEAIKKFILDNISKTIYFVGCISPTLKSFICQFDYKYCTNYEDIHNYFPFVNFPYENISYVGSYNTYNIPEYLKENFKNYAVACNCFKSKSEVLANFVSEGLIGFEFRFNEENIYKIKVSSGCSHSCNYCIIPHLKGKVKSRTIEHILLDIEKGYNSGYKYFLLLADDLASYGIDIYKKLSLCDLLKNIKERYSDIKIGLRYLEPMTIPILWNQLKNYITDDFIFALNIPIQSGSNNVLKAINRPDNINVLISIIKEMRENYSGPLLTHVIVGFPFETIDDINKTKQVLEYFDNTSVHIFSPRILTKFADYSISEQAKEHEFLINEYKKVMLAKYLKRIFYSFANKKQEISNNELEYRFKLNDDILYKLNSTYRDLKWTENFQQNDIVFKNPDIDGFIIRFRKDKKHYMQIKIKKVEHEWKEISIPITSNDLQYLINFVKMFMIPMGVVSKNRIFTNLINNCVRFYIDDVKHLGKYLEIEGDNISINEYVSALGLSIKDACPPYGKMLDELNLDIENEINDVLKKL